MKNKKSPVKAKKEKLHNAVMGSKMKPMGKNKMMKEGDFPQINY